MSIDSEIAVWAQGSAFEKESHYHSFLFKNAECPAFIVEIKTGKIIDSNLKASIFSGFSQRELSLLSFEEFLSPDDITLYKKIGEKKTGRIYPINFSFKTRNKHIKFIQSSCQIIPGDQNKYTCISFKKIIDISDQDEHLIDPMDRNSQDESELKKSYKKLENEIRLRLLAERHLEDVNTALKVMLKQNEKDKLSLGKSVLSNVNELILPYLEKLGSSSLDVRQKGLLKTIEANLKAVTSPFINEMSSKFYNLTPMEIQVANLVKHGKTNQEIADILHLSKNTVLTHRFHIRGKLGIKKSGINLRTRLLSFE